MCLCGWAFFFFWVVLGFHEVLACGFLNCTRNELVFVFHWSVGALRKSPAEFLHGLAKCVVAGGFSFLCNAFVEKRKRKKKEPDRVDGEKEERKAPYRRVEPDGTASVGHGAVDTPAATRQQAGAVHRTRPKLGNVAFYRARFCVTEFFSGSPGTGESWKLGNSGFTLPAS